MRDAGVTQAPAAMLRTPAQAFDLPDQGGEAERLVSRLEDVMRRVVQLHDFRKGIGIAAPQIGVSRAAALVYRSDSERVVLLNPHVVAQSGATDEQFEGCLSFFDVRGKVPRPLWIDVAYETLDGKPMTQRFENGMARLVSHEIDHLDGHLYVDRMRAGVVPIPVEEYTNAGRDWRYPER